MKMKNLLKKILFFSTFLILSCNFVVPNSEREEIWICHHPESAFHGMECTKKTEKQCLVEGDQTKFCWKMKIEDCEHPEIKKNVKFCQN